MALTVNSLAMLLLSCPGKPAAGGKKGEDSVKTDIKGGCNELNTLS